MVRPTSARTFSGLVFKTATRALAMNRAPDRWMIAAPRRRGTDIIARSFKSRALPGRLRPREFSSGPREFHMEIRELYMGPREGVTRIREGRSAPRGFYMKTRGLH